MLNLSYSTLPCVGWSVEKIVKYCKDYGFGGLELKEDNSILSINSTKEERKKIADIFRHENIIITNIGSDICVKGTSNQEIGRALEDIKREVTLANDLNAKGIRIFVGNFCRSYSDKREELNYGEIVGFMKRACDYASNYGKEIWIETHNEFATGKVLKNLLNDVNKKNCAVIWDIMHSLEDGESPEETLRYLGDKCKHIHVKDGIPFEDTNEHDWKYTFLGEGELPIKGIVKLLIENGYKGYFSLEWEIKWRKELQVPGCEAEKVLPQYVNFMKSL